MPALARFLHSARTHWVSWLGMAVLAGLAFLSARWLFAEILYEQLDQQLNALDAGERQFSQQDWQEAMQRVSAVESMGLADARYARMEGMYLDRHINWQTGELPASARPSRREQNAQAEAALAAFVHATRLRPSWPWAWVDLNWALLNVASLFWTYEQFEQAFLQAVETGREVSRIQEQLVQTTSSLAILFPDWEPALQEAMRANLQRALAADNPRYQRAFQILRNDDTWADFCPRLDQSLLHPRVQAACEPHLDTGITTDTD